MLRYFHCIKVLNSTVYQCIYFFKKDEQKKSFLCKKFVVCTYTMSTAKGIKPTLIRL